MPFQLNFATETENLAQKKGSIGNENYAENEMTDSRFLTKVHNPDLKHIRENSISP